MAHTESISQRDLWLRSKEIMDALERGHSFTLTRDGHEIGELVPVHARRRFVTRADFARASAAGPELDLEGFRADQAAACDDPSADPCAP